MAVLSQHKQQKRISLPFDVRCINLEKKDSRIKRIKRIENATLKNGILLNKCNTLFYGLISNNTYFNDLEYARSCNIIFDNFYYNHNIKKVSYYKIGEEIVNSKELTHKLNHIDYNCFKCNNLIEIKYSSKLQRKHFFCEKCYDKTTNNDTNLLLHINKFYDVTKKIANKNIKIIHEYNLKNLKQIK